MSPDCPNCRKKFKIEEEEKEENVDESGEEQLRRTI